MTWLKLEDNMLDHPKWRRAVRKGGDGVVAVWVRLVSWCSRNLTDGVIPADMLEEVADVERTRDRRKALDGLVFGSLLVVDGSGNGRVVDYLERNPSREQVLAERERRAQSQRNRRGGLSVTGHAETSDPPCNEVPSRPVPARPISDPPIAPQGGQHAGTVPTEEPSTGKRGSKPRAKREPKAETPLPVDFAPTDAHRAFATQRGLDLAAQLFAFKQHYAGRTASSWNGRLATWLTKAEPPRQAQRSNGFNAAQAPQRRVMTVEEARRQRELDEGSAS